MQLDQIDLGELEPILFLFYQFKSTHRVKITKFHPANSAELCYFTPVFCHHMMKQLCKIIQIIERKRYNPSNCS